MVDPASPTSRAIWRLLMPLARMMLRICGQGGRAPKTDFALCIGASCHTGALKHNVEVLRRHNSCMHERTRSNIKQLLEKQGKTARQLAIAISENYPGQEKLQPSTITRFLTGATLDMHYGLLKAIASELGTTVDGLTGDALPAMTDKKALAVLQAMEHLEEADKDIIVNTSNALGKRYPSSISATVLRTGHQKK